MHLYIMAVILTNKATVLNNSLSYIKILFNYLCHLRDFLFSRKFKTESRWRNIQRANMSWQNSVFILAVLNIIV